MPNLKLPIYAECGCHWRFLLYRPRFSMVPPRKFLLIVSRFSPILQPLVSVIPREPQFLRASFRSAMENAKYNSNLHSTAARLPLKRAPRACTRCNKRKVRCDGAVTGFPCTNCRLDGHPCSVFRSRASKARKRLPRVKQIEDISRVAQDPFLARVRPKPPHLSSSPSLGSSRT